MKIEWMDFFVVMRFFVSIFKERIWVELMCFIIQEKVDTEVLSHM